MSQTPPKSDANKAVVIFVGDRYFSRFGYRGRLQTAWCLAGAKLFGTWERDAVAKTLRQIRAKGRDCGFRVIEEKAWDPHTIGTFMFGERKAETEKV